MALSIFLARLRGPLFVAVGAGIPFDPRTFRARASERASGIIVGLVGLIFCYFDYVA